jgi:hypothetical protein
MGTGDARREIKRGVGRKSLELYAVVRTDAIGGWNLAFGAREEQCSTTTPSAINHPIMASCAIWKRTRGLALGSGSGPSPSHSRSHGAASRGGDAVSRPRADGCWLLLLSARPRAGGVVSRGRGAGGNGGTVAWSLEQRTVGAVAQSILTP